MAARRKPARRKPARKPARRPPSRRRSRPAKKKTSRGRKPTTRRRRRSKGASTGTSFDKLLLWGGGALVLYLIFRSRPASAATRALPPGSRLSEPRFFTVDGRGCVDSQTDSQVASTVCELCDKATPGSFNWAYCYPEES